MGVGGGAGKLILARGRFECEFYILDRFGGGGGDGYNEKGWGAGMLKPVPRPAMLQ